MKCFNITDVSTPDLAARGLVNATLAVRSQLIPPGESVDVPDDEASRRDAQSYVSVGALAVDVLPPAYALVKERMQKASSPPPPPPMIRFRRSTLCLSRASPA